MDRSFWAEVLKTFNIDSGKIKSMIWIIVTVGHENPSQSIPRCAQKLPAAVRHRSGLLAKMRSTAHPRE